MLKQGVLWVQKLLAHVQILSLRAQMAFLLYDREQDFMVEVIQNRNEIQEHRVDNVFYNLDSTIHVLNLMGLLLEKENAVTF